MNFPFSFVLNSAPAANVVFTPVGGLTAPVAAGTVLGTFSVAPAGWSGILALSPMPGDDDSLFSLSGMNLIAAQALTVARVYNGNITPTP